VILDTTARGSRPRGDRGPPSRCSRGGRAGRRRPQRRYYCRYCLPPRPPAPPQPLDCRARALPIRTKKKADLVAAAGRLVGRAILRGAALLITGERGISCSRATAGALPDAPTPTSDCPRGRLRRRPAPATLWSPAWRSPWTSSSRSMRACGVANLAGRAVAASSGVGTTVDFASLLDEISECAGRPEATTSRPRPPPPGGSA